MPALFPEPWFCIAGGDSRPPRRGGRGGFSLLELMAVVTLMGILVAVGMMRVGSGSLADFAAEADARRLALDLLQAQRRGISTGENHFIEFQSSGASIVGYRMLRRLGGGGTAAVEIERTFNTGETITASHSQLEYTFEGTALAAYEITLAGPHQTWRVSVIPVTGAVRVTRIAL